MNDTHKVYIFDTTLRDGEQAPGATMNASEKLEIAFALERLGVDIIEAGFPISSKGDFDSVQNVAMNITTPIICALARCTKKDIDAASESLASARRGRIHVFLATSKIHLQYKFKKSEEEIFNIAVESVRYARDKMDNIEFSPEDASRSDKKFLFRVLEAVIDAGATTVNIPDTVGYGMPEDYGRLIADIRNNVPNIHKAVISAHCHDDLGMAVSNSLAAIRNGARQVECTINGIGERAGNASMEEIVMALKTREDIFRCSTGIRTQEFVRISRLVSKLTGFAVPPNKAIVGANAFRHESGIHQDGILKERSTYEIMRPEDVGFTGTGVVLGKHSGRHAFKERLSSLGINLTEVELDRAFSRFKNVADKKKQVFEEDLLAIVEDEGQSTNAVWTLKNLVMTSGMNISPRAKISLVSKGKEYKKESSGDGPVDACYKAIDAVTKLKGELLEYSLQAVTHGKDAQGEVTVKVKFKDKSVIGHGTNTDIVVASAQAYINALNKAIAQSHTTNS